MKIIDAHAHLWLNVDTKVQGLPVRSLKNGRSIFLGEERQMLPPWLIDGRNTAEVFLSNMDYAQVSAAVITQEFIDGCQNDYLQDVARRYPDRFLVCGFCDYWQPGFFAEAKALILNRGFKAMAIPAHRLIADDGRRIHLNGDEMMQLFRFMEEHDTILSLCLADDALQLAEMEEVISECPRLKIAIGHFGLVTTPGWEGQVRLARHPNVYVESGGITWLFNSEFYPYDGAMKAIRQAADRVGIDKLMWGSDYPRTITAITYRMSYDFVLKSTLLTAEEKEAFLYKNAQQFYGFGELIDLPYIKNMSE